MSACVVCGKERDPKLDADIQWGVVEMEGRVYAVCALHLPSLVASTEERRQAYIALFKKIQERAPAVT